jgi:hypothetical protein
LPDNVSQPLHQSLTLLDVLKKDQQTTVHQMVQVAYQDWLKKQTADKVITVFNRELFLLGIKS